MHLCSFCNRRTINFVDDDDDDDDDDGVLVVYKILSRSVELTRQREICT